MSKENCSTKVTCPTCRMELDPKYLGKRCPRCNSIVIPKGCAKCKGYK